MIQDKKTNTSLPSFRWKKLVVLAKLTITGLILSYIFQTFQREQKGLSDILVSLNKVWSNDNLLIIILLVILIPLNWALESLKWQTLVNKIFKISFWQAFRGTLTGLAVGVAVPAQVGDTLGRLGALPSQNRMRALGAALVSNGIQFYVSIVGGTLGWLAISDRIGLPNSQQDSILTLLICLCLMGVLIGIFRKNLISFNTRKPFLIRIKTYLSVIGAYKSQHLLYATFLGGLRYLVFLGQFLLALSLFHFPVDTASLASCVSLIFLVKTILPAINIIGDLGIREFTALYVFQSFYLPVEEVLAATFLIWVVNVLGPLFIGMYLLWKVKIKRNYFGK